MGDSTAAPKNLDTVFDSFNEMWSPRIVAEVNDYDVRIAKVQGEHLWHAHEDTDEFFLVLEGEFLIDLRDADCERRVELGANDTFVVPKGTEHRPVSPNGARILMFEPQGESTTGDYVGDVPDHIDSTVGHRAE
jgi:mannose-6-phosphate isomerase-like protein (cupin superfamily)